MSTQFVVVEVDRPDRLDDPTSAVAAWLGIFAPGLRVPGHGLDRAVVGVMGVVRGRRERVSIPRVRGSRVVVESHGDRDGIRVAGPAGVWTGSLVEDDAGRDADWSFSGIRPGNDAYASDCARAVRRCEWTEKIARQTAANHTCAR